MNTKSYEITKDRGRWTVTLDGSPLQIHLTHAGALEYAQAEARQHSPARVTVHESDPAPKAIERETYWLY